MKLATRFCLCFSADLNYTSAFGLLSILGKQFALQ